MGGALEKIRTTRSILKAIANEQLLTEEQLLTMWTGVEKILNDRPITPIRDHPSDQLPHKHVAFDENQYMSSAGYLHERRFIC